MVIAEAPRSPTKLATEQTNAVVNIALMVRCLTAQISDPAPPILDCQPERYRRVRCIWLVGRFHLGNGCRKRRISHHLRTELIRKMAVAASSEPTGRMCS